MHLALQYIAQSMRMLCAYCVRCVSIPMGRFVVPGQVAASVCLHAIAEEQGIKMLDVFPQALLISNLYINVACKVCTRAWYRVARITVVMLTHRAVPHKGAARGRKCQAMCVTVMMRL